MACMVYGYGYDCRIAACTFSSFSFSFFLFFSVFTSFNESHVLAFLLFVLSIIDDVSLVMASFLCFIPTLYHFFFFCLSDNLSVFNCVVCWLVGRLRLVPA